MAAHSVNLKVEHPLTVGNVGVEFEVRRGGKLLGKLEVTQTTIDWTPAKGAEPPQGELAGVWRLDGGSGPA